MTGKLSGCWLVGAVVIGCVFGGCRQAEEQDGDATGANATGADSSGGNAGPPAGTVAGIGQDELPSKLAREEGRKADGRKAPAPAAPKYRIAVPLPGKEGFVFNPYTNNPVDVRGIPPGTLVRDPKDPDKAHTFRTPAQAPVEDGNDGGLTEIPVPEIP